MLQMEKMITQSDSSTLFCFRGSNLTQRQISILQRIGPFFSDNVAHDILMPLVNQCSGISLRALDWLVTNYAKKNNIVCKTRNNTLFNIYHGYKVALAHFRRRNFDPFRRRQRIEVLSSDGEIICESTVGQCNFLYWSYTHGVLNYAIENAGAIELDMNRASALNKAERRKQKQQGLPHRRRELSSAPPTKCSVYQVDTNVTFECMGASDSENDDEIEKTNEKHSS